MDGRRLIEALIRLGSAEARNREFAQARIHLERSLQLSLAMWPDAREDLRSFSCIGNSQESIGDLERLSGKTVSACEAYRKSLETWQAWPSVGVSSFYDREHAAKVRTKLVGCGTTSGASE